jgi:restriction endonuclease Mrr
MAIPDYQSAMLPLLRYAADGQEHFVREAIEELADQFQLTDQERKELLPSGRQATFDNRVGWARTYIKKAGLLNLLGAVTSGSPTEASRHSRRTPKRSTTSSLSSTQSFESLRPRATRRLWMRGR